MKREEKLTLGILLFDGVEAPDFVALFIYLPVSGALNGQSHRINFSGHNHCQEDRLITCLAGC